MAQTQPLDPSDIAALNAWTQQEAEPGCTIHPIEIRELIADDDALEALFTRAAELSTGGRALLVTDHTPMRRGNDDLKPKIAEMLADRCNVHWRRLPAREPRSFHASLPAARMLSETLHEYTLLISVGSGSITDVVKYARHLHAKATDRHVPMIAFPTAASVTAYTSALAVLTVDGVKRTLPARAPDIVICDLPTLTSAPAIMTQAGFGDVIARSVSAGDWYLANQLGMDDAFSTVPIRLLDHAEQEMLNNAAGVQTCRPHAVRTVTNALLLAGMAMSIVNQTAPLSGWEHVISHFCDLAADRDQRPRALHGGQVGVATRIAASAYQQLLEQPDLPPFHVQNDTRKDQDTVARAFGDFPHASDLRAEILRDLAKKRTRWNDAHAHRARFAARWAAGEIQEFLRQTVRTPDEIDHALRAAGAPRRFSTLDQPIPPRTARQAISFAHLIRARFTLGDLLAAGDNFTEQNIDDLMNDAS